MKSPLFAALAFCAMAFPAMAETVSSTVSPTVSVTPTSPVTAAIVISGTNILLPVVIDKTDGEKKLEARLVNLQSAGVELGMEAMILEGEAAASDSPEGGKDYAISWGTASLRTKAGGKVSTYITKPLQSNVSANPAVKGGDSFTAEGDPAELLAAWKRLQVKLKDEDKEEKEDAEKKTDAPAPTKDFGENAKEPEQKQQTQTPQFQVKTDPVTVSTRDGCSMNVDFDQMVAIVQERTLQDGKEVAACQDTLTRYPLEKKFTTCPNFVDLDAKKVFKQYTLNYNDPVSGGAIQVKDCTKDEEQVTPITVDTASCSLRHDFTAGKSIQQGRMVYTDSSGVIQELQSCADTNVSYEHIKTDDTCQNVVDEANKLVTRQFRYKINKDGTDQFVSQCEPDMTTSTPLQEEICTTQRYTNDFAANTSYLNKSYFYNDTQGNRVNVMKCQPSTVSFQHKKEEETCTATSDDSTLQTTMYAKTYIEETAGNKVYLSDCQPVSPKIPYTLNGKVWKLYTTMTKSFASNADDKKTIGMISDLWSSSYETGFTGSGGCSLSPGQELQRYYRSTKYKINGYPFDWSGFRNNRYRMSSADTNCQSYPSYGSLVGDAICVRGKVLPWTTTDGLTIDSADSTEMPSVNATYALNSYSMGISNGIMVFSMIGTPDTSRSYSTVLTCQQAMCPVSTLYGRNQYLRGDNTLYTDTSVITATKYVCGDGANLDGKSF